MSYNHSLYIFILFLSVLYFGSGCVHDPVIMEGMIDMTDTTGVDTIPDTTVIVSGTPCDPDSVYFINDILPFLSSNCAIPGCHDPGTAQDGVVLTEYFSIISTADVDPGDPWGSDLYEVLVESDPDKVMPPPGSGISVNPDQIQAIFDWILQGAPQNSCDPDCDTSFVSFSEDILPMINASCTGCHSGASPQAGITLDSYSNISGQALSGTLYQALTGDGVTLMPFNQDPLDDCKILQVQKWIEAGAPDN